MSDSGAAFGRDPNPSAPAHKPAAPEPIIDPPITFGTPPPADHKPEATGSTSTPVGSSQDRCGGLGLRLLPADHDPPRRATPRGRLELSAAAFSRTA